MNKKKRSTPPNPAAAARQAAQRKARDERQQNQGSPEHRHLPEGVPYRDPVSPLEEQFNPMCQALPEPPSLRLPPIYGPPPRQQPGPSHHQLPQSLPPPPLQGMKPSTSTPSTSTTKAATHPTHPSKATTSPIRFCWAITWNTPFPPSSSMDCPTESDWGRDRKSTRLNSSHANISYAVFCLKTKRQCPCTDTLAIEI